MPQGSKEASVSANESALRREKQVVLGSIGVYLDFHRGIVSVQFHLYATIAHRKYMHAYGRRVDQLQREGI